MLRDGERGRRARKVGPLNRSIFIGWDPREAAAYAVARASVQRHLSREIPVNGLVLDDLIERGLYARPMTRPQVGNRQIMWDVISDAPMSTEHACARFLTPHLAKTGWALFMDGDMLCRSDLNELFDNLDPSKAVYCVKHRHEPEPGVKMDDQIQTRYARKNWSSVIVFQCEHPANKALTMDLINKAPGRDLHRLCWLEDADIGELGPEWNYLVGHTPPNVDPKLVHFTLGTPDMPGYEDQPYVETWREELRRWAA